MIPALLLHSGFRTGSTWFWNRFRETAGTTAFYEPFNEMLEDLTREEVARHRAESWASGHPAMERGYFAEYTPLIRRGGGMIFYEPRFAMENYYLPAPDPAMARYIQTLIDFARSLDTVPVLGFCRSLGRVGWCRDLCEGTVNIVTWRNPRDQWQSCQAMAKRHRKLYFEARFFVIAHHGRRHPLYAPFFDGLDILPNPEDLGPVARMFQRPDGATERFRTFLRVFLLDMALALTQADLVVDLDRMSRSPLYRDRTADRLRALSGLPELDFIDCTLPLHDFDNDADYPALLAEGLERLDFFGATPALAPCARAVAFLRRQIERLIASPGGDR